MSSASDSPRPADDPSHAAPGAAAASEVVEVPAETRRGWIQSEDWLAVFLGAIILGVALIASWWSESPRHQEISHQMRQIKNDLRTLKSPDEAPTPSQRELIAAGEKKLETLSAELYQNPLKPWLAKLGSWTANPGDAFFVKDKFILPGLLTTLAACLLIFGLGAALQGRAVATFAPAFIVVFLLATLAYVLAGQTVIKNYNLEYALWALVIGMIISNTVGTPRALEPAIQTELYIKAGLVLLGAEILLSRLLVLGLPGIFVSWVVTPIVLIGTYLFGQYVLKMKSRSLNMVISADMSVCGVSAAIATAAACRAKKEELSLAIGLSLAFTVVMMVVMPVIIRAVGMSEVLGGAWLGGTIDSTGAVAAAGGMLGPTALAVAATVKMIQNILIGAVAFGVAVYWVTVVEREEGGERGEGRPRPRVSEIWRRFPKFVIGFVGASLVFSWIYSIGTGQALTEAAISGTSEILRGWFFCLAFVSIGLETNFRELAAYMKGGKPLVLYVCGQGLNLVLTLLMAWLMFEKVFPQAAAALGN